MSFFVSLLLWAILFVLCWPLALLVAAMLPLLWLLSIPFRVLGAATHAVIALIRAILLFPSRVLSFGR